MPALKLIGLSGTITPLSNTRSLIEAALQIAADHLDVQAGVIEVSDFGDQLGRVRRLDDLDASAQALIAQVLAADALIVATPVQRASDPGLFKPLFDLLGPIALLGKPVLIAATGGGERHALAVDQQLRPLFAYFAAQSLPTAVHVSDKDFAGGRLVAPAALDRLTRAVGQFTAIFPQHLRYAQAAE